MIRREAGDSRDPTVFYNRGFLNSIINKRAYKYYKFDRSPSGDFTFTYRQGVSFRNRIGDRETGLEKWPLDFLSSR